MSPITWTKPSGLEITTNDEPATVAYCESLGWERHEEGDELTLGKLKKMTGKGLKALIEEYELDVSTDGKVDEIRAAVIDALTEDDE